MVESLPMLVYGALAKMLVCKILHVSKTGSRMAYCLGTTNLVNINLPKYLKPRGLVNSKKRGKTSNKLLGACA